MEFNIQPFQLILIAVYVTLGFLFFKFDNKSFKITVVAIAVIVFFVNPIRFKQKGVESLERSISRFDAIPEKVEVKTPEYDDFHKNEIDAMRSQSEEKKDEVHN